MGLSFAAPLAGRDVPLYDEMDSALFQSTRPLRGATRDFPRPLSSLHISIHAPLAGRDTNKGANQNELHPIC